MSQKDYMTLENARNRRSAVLFADLMTRAFAPLVDTTVAHHLVFEPVGEDHPNEIPSADTIIFCHDAMTRVFGDRAVSIMRELAGLPALERDERLAEYLYKSA